MAVICLCRALPADMSILSRTSSCTLVSYLRDGVDLSRPSQINIEARRSTARIAWAASVRRGSGKKEKTHPARLRKVVDAEMQALVDRGGVVKWADVRDSGGRPGPRLAISPAVEETEPRLIYNARPRNKRCKKISFSMDTVEWGASVASQGCFMASVDDASAFNDVLLRPSSWPFFALS